jgi:hypothetical protein
MVGAVIVDEIRRIGGEQLRPLAVHQPSDILRAGRIAAQQPVLAEAARDRRGG